MPDETTATPAPTTPTPTPAPPSPAPAAPATHESALTFIHGKLTALGDAIGDVGHHLQGDAAVVVAAMAPAITALEQQLTAIVSGAAVPAATKFAAFLSAEFQSQLPAIIAAAEKAAEAKVVAAGAALIASA